MTAEWEAAKDKAAAWGGALPPDVGTDYDPMEEMQDLQSDWSHWEHGATTKAPASDINYKLSLG